MLMNKLRFCGCIALFLGKVKSYFFIFKLNTYTYFFIAFDYLANRLPQNVCMLSIDLAIIRTIDPKYHK